MEGGREKSKLITEIQTVIKSQIKTNTKKRKEIIKIEMEIQTGKDRVNIEDKINNDENKHIARDRNRERSRDQKRV